MKALLDTNFLMVPGERKVDILSELLALGYTEVFTLDLVVRELEKLSVSRGKEGRNARIGLEFIRKGGIVVLRSKERNTDDELLRLARTKKYVICTLDRGLIRKLREGKLRYISLRQGKYVAEAGSDF